MSENTASAKAEEKTEKRRRNPRSKSSDNANLSSKASLNLAELRELAELVNEHGFTDFEIENENIRIRLSKLTTPQIVQTVQPTVATATAPQASANVAETSPVVTNAEPVDNLHQITSPIVGTFYRSPSPDKAPYVSEGDNVSESTVVCIVEAMKLMNEIQAEASGEIVKIYVENGQPVEFGQPLFGIRK